MYNRNAAYDLRTLEKQKRKGQIVELPGRRARKKERLKTKRKVLTALFSLFLTSAAVVSVFVMGQVMLNKLTDETEKAYHYLNGQESSNTYFHMQLESQGAVKNSRQDAVHNEIVKIPKEALTEAH